MVAADFILTPAVVFSENNAGGVGGAAAGLFGRKVAAVAGGLKFKEAQTSMLVADSRSGIQVAAAEGSTKKADRRLGGALFGGGGGVFNEGDTLAPKIAGVKLLASPSDTAKVVATLTRTDEMVVVGEEKDGYIQVESGSGKGSVRMTLVQKH